MSSAHTFQRISAYVIDVLIITIISMLLTSWIPKSEEYKSAIEKENNLISDINKENLNQSDFIDELYETRYTIEKENITESLIIIVINLGYFVGFAYYNKGQSVGKKIMHIRVASNNGKDASYLQLFGRTLIIHGCFTSLLSIILLLFIKSNQYIYTIGLIGLIQSLVTIITIIMVIVRKDKKGLHDLICKTKVIEV